MHNLFLVYFVNLYTFRAYLDPSSGGATLVYKNWYLLTFLDDCLLSCLDSNQDSRQSTTKNYRYQLLFTRVPTSWWWA